MLWNTMLHVKTSVVQFYFCIGIITRNFQMEHNTTNKYDKYYTNVQHIILHSTECTGVLRIVQI